MLRLISTLLLTVSVAAQAAPADPQAFPRTLLLPDAVVTIHEPQLLAWTDFRRFEGVFAFQAKGQQAEDDFFGTVEFSADAVPDKVNRTVAVADIQVDAVRSAVSPERLAPFREAMQTLVEAHVRAVPLDLVVHRLTDEALPVSPVALKVEPPEIIVAREPAVLVLAPGGPVVAPLGDDGLERVLNANWPIYEVDERFWLQTEARWFVADKFGGPWVVAPKPPKALAALTLATADATGAAPKVFARSEPAELILIEGKPKLEPIGNTGISYVSNTQAVLLKHRRSWYFLVSGRWFESKTLGGKWAHAERLPEAFGRIPADHVMAKVRSSVPGTFEARLAAVEALIPSKQEVKVGDPAPVEVVYAGEPKFAAIEGASVEMAINTGFDVLLIGGEYWLCYEGVWYVAASAAGPFKVAAEAPAEDLDSIPPSSPAHHVTYVRSYPASTSTVVYSYPASYYGVYVYGGVPVYGTGFYYPPYIAYYPAYRHPVYYGWPTTYGRAAYYNTSTGAYGSVNRAYGPYAGWGSASAYNPNTGTYAAAEAVWDHDEFRAVAGAYNPNSGRYYQTDRYFKDDGDNWYVDTTVGGTRGDVAVTRAFDNDSGSLQFEGSGGTSGTATRYKQGDGWVTQSEVTTRSGETIRGTGSFEDGQGATQLAGTGGGSGTIEREVGSQGATRSGDFSRGDESLESQTVRSGRSSASYVEGSEGGQAASGSRGFGTRTTVGQTAEGDLYAGRNGNVYRHDGSGWARHTSDGWQQMQRPDRTKQLSRDRSARQRGERGGRGRRRN